MQIKVKTLTGTAPPPLLWLATRSGLQVPVVVGWTRAARCTP